jgi:hypothetical protein
MFPGQKLKALDQLLRILRSNSTVTNKDQEANGTHDCTPRAFSDVYGRPDEFKTNRGFCRQVSVGLE